MNRILNFSIGLFIPCYIDQFYSQVGIATLKLLQKLGLDVHYSLEQTLDSEQICGNMHTAYSRLENRTNGFGIFVPGSSKMADIVQSLVLGVHGAKEYFMVCY